MKETPMDMITISNIDKAYIYIVIAMIDDHDLAAEIDKSFIAESEN